MQGKVDSIEKSKSGKSWRVKIEGKYYGAGLDSQIEGAKGKSIDFTAEDTDFGLWIKSWAYAQSATTQNGTAGEHGGEHPGLTEAEMRFVSNVVGQAILAKTITDPLVISQWAKAARATLKELG